MDKAEKIGIGILLAGGIVGISIAIHCFCYATISRANPIIDDIECVGGCKCNDAGGCKCFTKAHDSQCRCQNCTCKDEDK